MMSPRVSVLIPCFNLGRFLPETIESVQRQTWKDFEILVVDDGSDDEETRQLLMDSTWPRTQVYRTANRGLAAARNFLIERARGEYLCALDADDILHPEYLERTVAVLDDSPDLSFVSTHLEMFGIEQRVWPDVARCDLEMLLCDDTIITAALVRCAAVREIGGYDEHMPEQGDEDWDLWIRLVDHGFRGTILPNVLFRYRRRPDSMVVRCTSGETHLRLSEYLVRKHETRYRENLQAVLLWKEDRISEVRRANMKLEQEIGSVLGPTVGRRRDELRRLEKKLVAASAASDAQGVDAITGPRIALPAPRIEELEREYARSMAEIRDLRASWSWRITLPFRRCYDMATRVLRGVRR